jgi:hypothetical protein
MFICPSLGAEKYQKVPDTSAVGRGVSLPGFEEESEVAN